MDFHTRFLWESLSYLAFDICWPTFIVRFLGQPRRRLYWTTIAFAIATFLTFVPYLLQWTSAAAFTVIVFLTSSLMWAGILLLIWIPARRGDADARLLVAPTLLFVIANLARGVVLVGLILRPLNPSWWDRYNSILTWPFTFSVKSLADFVTQAAVLAIVVLRFARKSRDEERLANEIESARTVQQVLVPAENPSILGFAIEAVYKPASEVGGDFFQIVPTASGGVLIVIGDRRRTNVRCEPLVLNLDLIAARHERFLSIDIAALAEQVAKTSQKDLDMAYERLKERNLGKMAIALRTADYADLLPQMLRALEEANHPNSHYLGWARHSYNDTLPATR